MKLLELTLENFKGIRSFVLDAKGESVSIYGDNAAGKTTTMDAFMWGLFDKDSRNRKDFQIKTLDENGNAIPGLDHGVSIVLELPGGGILRLRKVFKEVWTKKRGQARREFTGHTTDYYIDGVPVKKGEYTERIAQIADEGIFRLLSDPMHFNENLHWEERRRILLDVCGDVTNDDVIASDKKLAPLAAILGERSLDDHRKVVDARRREINKELDRIPVRIDELNKTMPQLPEKDRSTLEAELDRLKQLRQGAEQHKARIEAGGEIAEKRRRIAEIDAEMLEIRNELRAQSDRVLEQKRAEHRELAAQIDAIGREVRGLKDDQDDDNLLMSALSREIERLKASWYEVDAEQFDHNHTENCPTCGQSIPQEQALATFNAHKSARLANINELGKKKKAELEELLAKQADRNKILVEKEKILAKLEADADRLAQEIMQAAESAPSADDDPGYRKLAQEKVTLLEQIKALQEGSAEALKDATDNLAAIDDRIYVTQVTLSQFEQRERAEARIQELMDEERRLAAEFEQLEHEAHLCETFIRSKVQLLEERINSRFKLARFKLFEQQVNGGVKECCETTFHGVPFSSLNHGARLNVGLDIINTLAEHYGFAPPVFIDNAESVTNILPTTGQQIRLVVSEPDKTLRVETVERQAVLV